MAASLAAGDDSVVRLSTPPEGPRRIAEQRGPMSVIAAPWACRSHRPDRGPHLGRNPSPGGLETMATVASTPQPRDPRQPTASASPLAPIETPCLAPIEKPKGLMMKLLYRFLGRQFGKVPGWLSVFSARMPLTFTSWMGKVYKLDGKLKLPADTARLIRERVNGINGCTWCLDAGRWYAIRRTPHLVPRLDALHEYQTSPCSATRSAQRSTSPPN
jgi:hypothetical protein